MPTRHARRRASPAKTAASGAFARNRARHPAGGGSGFRRPRLRRQHHQPHRRARRRVDRLALRVLPQQGRAARRADGGAPARGRGDPRRPPRADAPDAPRRPAPAIVRRFVRAMVEFHARDRALHRVLFEETPLPPRIRRHARRPRGSRSPNACTAICARTGRAAPRPRRSPPPSSCRPSRGSPTSSSSTANATHSVEPYVEEMVALVTAYLAAE